MADPNVIQGSLNFGSPAGFDFTGNPANLGSNYTSAYQNALAMNQQNYGNILAGFQQTMGAQNQAQNQIQAGYGRLQGDVLAGIQGIGASQGQAIKDAYAQQSGAQAQNLVARGLGNTTVANSVQRGLTLDKQKADIALANQIAGLTAGYQSNLGLAGLNFGNQANMQNTALANQQLGWMNSVNAPYPNASLYGQLATQYGASQQQGRLTDALAAAQAGGGGQRGLGLGAYTPAGGGFTRTNDFGGGNATQGVPGGAGGYSQLAVDQASANRMGRSTTTDQYAAEPTAIGTAYSADWNDPAAGLMGAMTYPSLQGQSDEDFFGQYFGQGAANTEYAGYDLDAGDWY